MTVTVPSNEKTGAAALQSQITALSSRTDQYSVQLLGQRQIDLVNCLLDQHRISAANVISVMPAPVAAKRNTLYAALQVQNTLITAIGSGPTAASAAAVLDQLQRQLVLEEMASGARTAALILSTLTYSGSAAS